MVNKNFQFLASNSRHILSCLRVVFERSAVRAAILHYNSSYLRRVHGGRCLADASPEP